MLVCFTFLWLYIDLSCFFFQECFFVLFFSTTVASKCLIFSYPNVMLNLILWQLCPLTLSSYLKKYENNSGRVDMEMFAPGSQGRRRARLTNYKKGNDGAPRADNFLEYLEMPPFELAGTLIHVGKQLLFT